MKVISESEVAETCEHYGVLGYMYLFKLEFSLNICPGVGFMDHTVILLLSF